MASYTNTDLLSAVRQRGAIPTSTNSSNVNNTTNLLNLATEELHIKLLPLIMSARAEFYVRPKNYTITAEQADYVIPARASGQVLRDVQIVTGSAIKSLPEIPPEDVTTTTSGPPESYYLEDNRVILYPTPSTTTGTLRLRYFIRPGRLAATSDCAQISAIDTGTGVVTVNAVPSSWSTATPLDLVAASAPYKYREIDQSPTAVSGADITFSTLPSDLAVGDWICLAEYSPIPQIPQEFQPVLAQMTVVKALESIGDKDGVARALKDLEVLQTNALQLITPRNHGEPRTVKPTRWR